MSNDHVNGFHDPSEHPDAPSGHGHTTNPGCGESTDSTNRVDTTGTTAQSSLDRLHVDPDTQTFPMVSVKWKDAESQGGPSWEDAQEMLEFAQRPLVLVHTVGQLLHIDDEKIAITDTISGDQMGGVSKIPRMWIMEIVELAPRDEAQDSPLSFTDENGNERNRSVG
ncbi:MAG: hypothetical protein MK085_05435 [Phycisphaerales bacterium]|nr:hypothetical protein [Phycisphaerales bacterium]